MKKIIPFLFLAIVAGADATAGCNMMIDAARTGNITTMSLMTVLNKQIVNCHDQEGTFPLYAAAYSGNLQATDWLLRHKANANQHSNGFTALYAATIKNHHAVIEKLIRGGADINMASSNGWTPVMAAAQAGDLEMTKLLHLSYGANIKTGALSLSSTANKLEVVKYLVENGAAPADEDGEHHSALYYAASYCGVEVIDYFFSLPLVQFDRIQLEDALKRLSWARCWDRPYKQYNLNQVEIKTWFEKFVRKTGTLSTATLRGLLIAVLTVDNGALSARYLVSIGAPVNTLDSHDRTVLMSSSYSLDDEEITALLELGADPNLNPVVGSKSALQHFVMRAWDPKKMEEDLNIIRLFYEKGTALNYRNSDGKTALGLLKERSKPWTQAVELMISLGACE